MCAQTVWTACPSAAVSNEILFLIDAAQQWVESQVTVMSWTGRL